MQQDTGRPAGRYGDQRGLSPGRRRATMAGVAVLAAAFLGWVIWAALGAASPDVRADVTAFRVRSDAAVAVRVEVGSGSDGPVGCTVQALDRTRGVVGVGTIRLDPSRPGRREGWVTVRTRDRAVAATLGTCAPVSPK